MKLNEKQARKKAIWESHYKYFTKLWKEGKADIMLVKVALNVGAKLGFVNTGTVPSCERVTH